MGSPDTEASDDKKPTHRVTLDDCYMVKYELTQAKWQSVMLDNPCYLTGNNLPVENESWEVSMFDPPFVLGASEKEDASQYGGIIGTRFTAFKDFAELKEMYSKSLKEFYRILRTDGIVIFKCQDCNSSSKQHFTHCWVMYEAMKYGFYPKDLFILFAK